MPASAGTQEVFDQGLNYIVNNVTHFVPLDNEPTNGWDDVANPSSASPGEKLGKSAISASELSIQDDGSGGREIAVPKKGYLAIEDGDVDHIALIDENNDTILVYYEHDDGNGNAVSVTKDLGYNIEAHTVGFQDFQSA